MVFIKARYSIPVCDGDKLSTTHENFHSHTLLLVHASTFLPPLGFCHHSRLVITHDALGHDSCQVNQDFHDFIFMLIVNYISEGSVSHINGV